MSGRDTENNLNTRLLHWQQVILIILIAHPPLLLTVSVLHIVGIHTVTPL